MTTDKRAELANHLLTEVGTTSLVRHYFRVALEWDDKVISYDDVLEGIANGLDEFTQITVISINEDDDCKN